MRIALAAALAAAFTLGSAHFAAASCAPPVSVAQNAARADAVVHGTVTAAGGGAITVNVDRVLKGEVRTPLRVFVGPGRGGFGTTVATSVDYAATVGSNHVLYVTRAADGDLETNACGGSHPGAPSDGETAFFGAGTTAPAQPDAIPPWALAMIVLAAFGLAVWLFRRPRVARPRSEPAS